MNDRAQPPGAGFETALVVAGGSVFGVGLATWLGARLAAWHADGTVGGGLGEWLAVTVRLARGVDPDTAWGPLATNLPGPVLYWAATGIVYLALVAVLVAGVWLWRRVDPARTTRRRFGQDTDARQARPRDVAPLVVKHVVPPVGRMLLGRMAGRGPLLATEDRQRHPMHGRAARRQGNRGSVALIGPTGSGKTALATSAIATWNGPVVAVSVKRDLYDTTVSARAQLGDIAVFDPGGATGLPTARWSPLEATITSTGALRTGRALAQAIPKGGVTNAEYWAEHGESLLGAFMCIAGLARLLTKADGTAIHRVGMEQLATWVRTLALATEPTINDLLRKALDPQQPLEVQLLGRHAAVAFIGVAREDHKIRSSVYSTAVLALKPWLEPAVAHSASDSIYHDYTRNAAWLRRPGFVDLDWLMAGDDTHANTLYLAAPSTEFERLSPVLGGLLADLKDTIHAWDIAGRRLDKPLLIVIDEAAQLQLGWLPTEVSTIAALGAFFVTCWQNLAQINHRYGSLADAVLSGHRTKCFFAGIDDLSTTRYLTGLLGHEHVERLGWSHDVPNMFGNNHPRRSVSRSSQREELASANTLRQMYPGEAVLLHGTLPPVHLNAIRWWDEKHLAALVPLDRDGNPSPPEHLVTCRLTETRVTGDAVPVVDVATLRTALTQLPSPTNPPPADTAASTARPKAPAPGQGSLLDPEGRPAESANGPHAAVAVADRSADAEQRADNRVSGSCELCGHHLRPGQGRQDRRGGRKIIRCAPSCTERRRLDRGDATP